MQVFCKIEVEETNNPDCPFKFHVSLDGELIKKLSTTFRTVEKENPMTKLIEKTKENQLKEAYDWLHCIKTNIAVHDGVFPAARLKQGGVVDLFAKADV